MTLLLAALALAHAEAPLTIHVDATATTLTLNCAGKTYTQPVVNGTATFPEAPKGCTVVATFNEGTIPGPGVFSCSPHGCIMQDVIHDVVTDAPGRVNVILTGTYDSSELEITCPNNGYRQRAPIANNTAKFEAVPSNDNCQLSFKGGTPAHYKPIVPGSYRCGLTEVTAVCTKFTP